MLSQTVKNELKAIVGEGRYFDNQEDLLMYSYDAFMVKAVPEAVLLPVRTEEISQIMELASRDKIPVTPRGAGTNLTGGSVPTRGGIVLGFTKMNQILADQREVPSLLDSFCQAGPKLAPSDLCQRDAHREYPGGKAADGQP